MGFDTGEVRIGALTEVGAHVELQLEEREKECLREQGAAKALLDLVQKLPAISAAADAALDGDPNRADHIGSLEELKLVKLWLAKVTHAAESAALSAKNRGMLAQGAVHQLTAEHDWLQKQIKVARAKIDAAKAVREAVVANVEQMPGVILDEDGDPVYVGDGAAPQGIRPGNRAQRRAYAEAQEQKAKSAPKKKTTRKKATKKKATKRGSNGRASHGNT
jgi:hypothetical protein